MCGLISDVSKSIILIVLSEGAILGILWQVWLEGGGCVKEGAILGILWLVLNSSVLIVTLEGPILGILGDLRCVELHHQTYWGVQPAAGDWKMC